MFETGTGSVEEPSGLSPAELVDRIGSREKELRSLVAAQLVDIAAFDSGQRAEDAAARVGVRLVGRSVGVQVGLGLGISATAGAARVAFARSVVEEHPALWRLAADGLVGEWHLRTVVAATDELTGEQKQVVARRLAVLVRARVSRGVGELTPHQLAQAATRLVIAADPDAATRRYERARRVREVSVTGRRDGAAALWVKGPAEQTQHMYDEVERDALTRRHDGDPRALAAIMFEQIYETLTSMRPTPGPDPTPEPAETDDPAGAATGADAGGWWGLAPDDLDADDPAHDSYCHNPGPLPPRPVRHLMRRQHKVEAQVVMSAATLLGLDQQPALLRGYGAIPAEIARRIADTSSDDEPSRVLVRRLFCDPVDGRLVQMESKTRLFTGPLRQFAIFRDQACRLTGGRIRDIDHLREAAHGGPTTAANGQALAKNPHVLRDHPGVHVRTRPHRGDRAGPPGDPLAGLRANAPNTEWTFPTGHTHLSEPPPALGHGSTPDDFAGPAPPLEAIDVDREAQRIRDNRLHTKRLASPSAMERALYHAMRKDPKFNGR